MPGIDECLLEAMRLPGARGAALVDWTSGLALGTVGESPGGDQEAAAVETAELARLAAEQHAFAPGADGGTHEGGTHKVGIHEGGTPGGNPLGGDDPPIEDLIISNRDSYHLLRFVRTSFDSSVCLHLWLTRAEGNLALARIRLGEMAGRLVLE
ncbi:hypothetical protein K4B79_25955 [Streptomyces lincolnensis]|uniref:hypothetical protein n=1 Tax=Streptomyces lincolnensis TaxID=1915 RepID=UPI001E3FBFFE|nr:hypothetical protein [Streptomyces lincolnensis]MCD7441655.1 hypothetical protein [Streptomyces lincolnensis]